MAVTGANPNKGRQTGMVGGMTWNVQAFPSTPTLSYTSGKILGGVMAFNSILNSYTGVMNSINISDSANQSGAMNIYIFNTLPVGTYTDGASFTMNSTDLQNCIYCYSVQASTSSWVSGGGCAVASITGLGKEIASSNPTVLWVLAVAQGSYTYAANSLTFTLGMLQD